MMTSQMNLCWLCSFNVIPGFCIHTCVGLRDDGELISHILEVDDGLEINFHHFDPMLPTWNGQSMVFDANKQMVDNLKICMATLKFHGHTLKRDLLKLLIRNTL